MVLGHSPLERFWRVQVEREFAPFAGRVEFEWLDLLSLEAMRRRVAALPPHSAVFYGTLNVDAAGVPHEENEGLAAIRSASSAPVFGLFESQLGQGIVGGPLVSIEREGKRSAKVALALLGGEAPAAVDDSLRRAVPRPLRLARAPSLGHRPAPAAFRQRDPVPAAVPLGGLPSPGPDGPRGRRRRDVPDRARCWPSAPRRRRAEERVRALNRRLITAQEDERKSIARELHDDLSQRLARLSIDAAQLERHSTSRDEAGGAAEMRGELTKISEDVHRLAYQLHPSTLDDLGLTEALRIECDRLATLESLPVRLRAPESVPELSRDASLGLFRVAQEALRNAARHARANTIDLALEAEAGGVRLSIQRRRRGLRSAGRPGSPGPRPREHARAGGAASAGGSTSGALRADGTTIDVWAPSEARAS